MERPMIPEERTSPLLIQEAVLWGIIAVGIFLFISNFGFGGFLGGVLSDVGFGIFGWMAYLFPILLVFFTAFLMSNRGSAIAGVKFVSAVILYLTVCSFFGLAHAEEYEWMKVGAIYERSAAYKNGGGAVGGCLLTAHHKKQDAQANQHSKYYPWQESGIINGGQTGGNHLDTVGRNQHNN